ncbi:Enhancer of polycomb-like protein 1 [Malassezia cuniculi]|uniref:Enhancer of polycomb-like protein n=1 Tax=Malassezia cuniculi TaxID=948313 RepID=A0AAF0J5H3_9BASI|nr:Enhancer of polycomb-like protein 1 [Malassezia cuniculi]
MSVRVSNPSPDPTRSQANGATSSSMAQLPIAASRVRTKKLSHKQKLCVQRGSQLPAAANALINGIVPDIDGGDNQQDSTFGVESHELVEHHLQAALSSSQLETVQGAQGANAPNKPAYHIPTPKSNEVLTQAQYDSEYPPNSYSDPVTYVRFSDTVECSIRGAPYCMDEDDQTWLDRHNDNARKELNQLSEKARTARAQDPAFVVISQDVFETVMSVFEITTCESYPFLKLDCSAMPKLEDLLPEFEPGSNTSKHAVPELPPLEGDAPDTSTAWSPANPFKNLSELKPAARAIYPWWKIRREDRQGKPIVPTLNTDDSNDNDPYVCFRRREVKTVRKTRKTDILQLEKLVRLKSELEQATKLVLMVAQRERYKERQIQYSRDSWDLVGKLLEFKRKWSIPDRAKNPSDEDLMFSTQSEVSAAAASAGAAQLSKKKRKAEEATSTTLKLRRPKTETPAAKSTAEGGIGAGMLERIDAIQTFIERETLHRQQIDAGIEDLTDTTFQPTPAPPALRAFRPIQSNNNDTHFWSNHPFARLGRQPCFRRRVGRGGRVYLDRRPLVPSPAPASLMAWPQGRSDSTPTTFRCALASEWARRAEAQPNSTLSYSDAYQSAMDNLYPRLAGPFAYTSCLKPELLPTPDLSWGAAGSTNSHALPFADIRANRSEASMRDSVGPSAEVSSMASDSSERSRSSSSFGGASSTQATEYGDEVDKGDISEDESQPDAAEMAERIERLAARWRYDEDGGRWAGLGLVGLGGMEGDEEAVLDDFDPRFIRYRMSLLDETNLVKLSTDWTYMRQALAAAEVPAPPHSAYQLPPKTETVDSNNTLALAKKKKVV